MPWRHVGSRHAYATLAGNSFVLLLLLLPQLLAAVQRPQLAQLGQANPHTEPGRAHRNAVQKIRMLQRLRAAEWEVRRDAVEDLLLAYKARHQACVNSEGLPGPYFVLHTLDNVSGIGNQLPSVVSGFLLALMMDRCFFVDFPFFNTYFTHELDFSWEHHKERLLLHNHDVEAPDNAPEMMPFGYVMLADTWLLKDVVKRYEGTYGVMLWRDLDYSAALLQSNPHHQEWLDRHFPTREMFAPLAAFLLHIEPEYEDRISSFRQKHFGFFTIGLQIRRLKCSGDYAELHCELRPSVEAFCQVAQSIQYAHGLRDEDVRFFLAADEPATYTKVLAILGKDRVVYTNNGIAPPTASVGEADEEAAPARFQTSAANPGTLESALMDMALLSRCHDLVVTGASSFGYVAAAWGGLAPVHMVYGWHNTSQNPYWWRAITSEPCFWQAKNMLQDIRAGSWVYREEALRLWEVNPFWMQYTQCHNNF